MGTTRLYYLTVDSHWNGARYVIDDSDDDVDSWAGFPCYYANIAHSVQETTGIYDEKAKGDIAFDCGLGINTPWGIVYLWQEHIEGAIWVYASGYWTYEWS